MTVETDRGEFTRLTLQSEQLAASGDVEAANAATLAANDIVGCAADVADLLLPLLEDPSPHVRYAVAAHLLKAGHSDHAVPELERIGAEGAGLVSADAKLALRRWRKHQAP